MAEYRIIQCSVSISIFIQTQSTQTLAPPTRPTQSVHSPPHQYHDKSHHPHFYSLLSFLDYYSPLPIHHSPHPNHHDRRSSDQRPPRGDSHHHHRLALRHPHPQLRRPRLPQIPHTREDHAHLPHAPRQRARPPPDPDLLLLRHRPRPLPPLPLGPRAALPLRLLHRLRLAFPSVTSLTVYSRSSSTVEIVASLWPRLRRVKLVRWHQRPQSNLGADFDPLFQQCHALSDLDLSEFYYWTEDLPPILEAHPNVARSLTKLNLLTASFTEGFRATEIRSITVACPKLQQLFVACMFDPRYMGFVGEEALLSISTNCPELRVVHLIDTSSLLNARGDPNDDGFTLEDAQIGRAALVDFFSGLPLLEELVLDVCKNVRDSGLALEVLASKCPRLRALKLGQFHGLCSAIGSRLDGIALCHGLESLSVKNCGDLTDMGLIEIARGCCKLAKFEVYGCKKITVKGLRTLASLLRKTLVDVSISCCKNLDAAASVRALEPIRDRVQRLHIDCVWQRENPQDFDLNQVNNYDVGDDDGVAVSRNGNDYMSWCDEFEQRISKKCKYGSDGDCSYMPTNGHGNGNGFWGDETWERLHYLSLWIEVGDLLTSLPEVGLDDCPNLEEVQIRVEGDCRGRHKPTQREFGLSCLARYPQLSKMKLDCGDTVGFALTAPPGQMDLSLWERFFLSGIGNMSLSELDYWPPQDRDVNQRSLWLPAAGLLAECITLRKLFIHGTAHEHFMMFLVRPDLNLSLRDVQLREDYYPAPENEMSTEMRVDSCCRFEDALNRRPILD